MSGAPRVRFSALRRHRRWTLLGLLLVGLAGRLWLADLGTRHAYLPDHVINVGWGLTANERGWLRIFDIGPGELAEVRIAGHEERSTRTYNLPNHSPLVMVVYALQTQILSRVQSPPRANSFAARAIMALIPTVFDLLTALGAGLLARRLFDRRAGWVAGIVTWLMPPLALNTAFWGQVDSMFVAPALFLLLFLLRREWGRAGLSLAAGLLLKPQALLLLPIVILGVLLPEEGAGRPSARLVARRLATSLGLAAGVVAVLTLPWTLVGGWEGGIPNWIRRGYLDNLLHAFPKTTLMAFNVWYLDLLRLDGRLVFADDSGAHLLGLSKDLWGRLLLLGALLLLAGRTLRSFRGREQGLAVFACLWLWSAFIWPTRCHERYILYPLPFLAVLAAGRPRLWAVLAPLILLGTAEHTWSAWSEGGRTAGGLLSVGLKTQYANLEVQQRQQTAAGIAGTPLPTWEEFLDRSRAQAAASREEYLRGRRAVAPWEWFFTLLSLAAYAAALRLLLGAGSGLRGRGVREEARGS